MATLWGGRFTKETAEEVFRFNASLPFDIRLLPQDVRGSIAHVKMLAKQEIISKEDAESIENGLLGIAEDYKAGTLFIDPAAEDVHSLIEAEVISRIGEAGKRMHTGRSRNDQVALDMKLYIRDMIPHFKNELAELLSVLLSLMKAHTETVMPGFTHMQKAQPVTLAHHLGAYAAMFRRDAEHLDSLLARMDTCPLGSGALAGTTYPLDRAYTARLLGFARPSENSMDGVADRDYLIEFLGALSVIAMHLSRFSEEIIAWNSDEYRFITLDDAYATGSSIMPQKKNPDIAELVRGKCGRVYAAQFSLLTVMKGIPLAYNKDMQEDKELSFDAIDTVSDCLHLFSDMLRTAIFHPDQMLASAGGGFTNATDVADALVRAGLPFRDAHRVAGELVLTAIERKCTLEELPFSVYKEASPLFEETIYEEIRPYACAMRRKTAGAPGAAEEAIRDLEHFLSMFKGDDAND